ncbi:LysR family transcriptional regulator [Ruegeria sp. R14_0]|uniref:LysR family transcriptional regulator n=1 Tax=Ruegeria sp. R14_0 TaxID=2821100 RepID=UPI001ADC0938|nr:LysR family transcriptional regulator [Ruegeria sp. R14_0]MBO9446671.1 LysR family transcriptional regulator [Ruegeria sp. R14_0]
MKLNAPMNALKAFEAAARTGSFTAAAAELGVSSPAVSQQVKLLEDFWQQALFIRQGNRLSLTDAGQTAYPQLAQAMASLAALSAKMQSEQIRKTRLVLSAPHSVVETWLPGKLAPLMRAEEYTPIDVRVDEDPIDFARDKIDMRIFFGHDLYGDFQVHSLFADHLIAVASPDFIRQFGAHLQDMPDKFLIHTHWGSGFTSSPNWEAALPVGKTINRDLGMSVRTSSVALVFARHGFGVALVPAAMAADDLYAERLVQLDSPYLELPRSYRLAYPKRLQSHPTIVRVLGALSHWADQSKR